MATINSIKSQDKVMESMTIYIENEQGMTVLLKAEEYRSYSEIKQLIIDAIHQKKQSQLITYTSNTNNSLITCPYASYQLIFQIRSKKSPSLVYSRKISNLERPLEMKKILNNNSKIQAYFIFEDSLNMIEYASIHLNNSSSSKHYHYQQKSKQSI